MANHGRIAFNGEVTDVIIQSDGAGYSAGELYTEDTYGTGFKASYTVSDKGEIESVTVINSGSGYINPPTLYFTSKSNYTSEATLLPILSSSANTDNKIVLPLQLKDNGVTAGSYTYSDITVDSSGRITSISSNTLDETIINGSKNAVQNNAVYDALLTKQDTLTFGLSSGNALKSEEALTTNDILLAGSSNIKGRTYSELKADLSLEIGTDVLAQQTIGIADNNLVEIDHASVADDDFAKFTANGLEGRSYSEVRTDLGLVIGTNVLAEQTVGIADDNLVEIDDADAADDDYAKFTANGLEGRSYTEVKTDLSLNNVSNDAQLPLTGGTITATDFGANAALTIDADQPSTLGAEDSVGLHIDYDRAAALSGTNAHNDIGIDLDVNAASLGVSSVRGMDIDVVGATSGTHTAIGIDLDVDSADTNIGMQINTAGTHLKLIANADTDDYATLAVADTGDLINYKRGWNYRFRLNFRGRW